MKPIAQLTEILDQNAELYEQMTEKTAEEKSVLDSASFERLSEIVKAKETIALKIKMLEETRAGLMEKIGKKLGRPPGEITLKELAEMPENSRYREKLTALRERLKKAGDTAMKVNDFNRGLIDKAMATVGESIRYATGLIDPAVTYSPRLSLKKGATSGRMIRKSF